jgi:uncharacterized protein YbjT (DUF2867 family)
MEASPPLSNAGPRKKTQTKVASEQALAWSGLPVVTIRPTFVTWAARYIKNASSPAND